MTDLAENLMNVRESIRIAAERAGRDPNEITLVAVSKTFPAETILAAQALGVRHLGENRVEEAAVKIPLVNRQAVRPITWHMIGHLQHRKVKEAVTLFNLVHSVDSTALARRLDARAGELGKKLPVLLEINVSGELNKYGFTPEPREELFKAIAEILTLSHLDVQGLMTMAPVTDSPEQARPYFQILRELRDAARARFDDRAWQHLSMGMTDDFEAAIAEGATMVRIGRAIFGARAPSHPGLPSL